LDLVLGQGVVAALLARIEKLRLRMGMAQDLRVNQVVVDDDVRLFQAPDALERNQPRVPRTGADDIDLAFFHDDLSKPLHNICHPREGGGPALCSTPKSQNKSKDPGFPPARE